MEGCVSITCNDETHKFAIEDIDPDILQQTFNLLEPPSIIFQTSSNLAIPIPKRVGRLQHGESYYIKAKPRNISTFTDESDAFNRNPGNAFHGDTHEEQIILNSLIASAAIYHSSDETEEESGGKCGAYLTEQIDNHNFEYIVRSKFGENHYLIVKVT